MLVVAKFEVYIVLNDKNNVILLEIIKINIFL